MNERQGKNGGGEALCDVLYQRITSSSDAAIKVALSLVDEADKAAQKMVACATGCRTSDSCQQPTYAVQQNCSLFDHRVGALLELQRYVEAEHLCGLEVDH